MPSAAAVRSMNAVTAGVSSIGQRCSASRVRAATRAMTAFSSLRRDPCPARPVAVSSMCAVPRSAVPTAYRRTGSPDSEVRCVVYPPDSPIAAAQPSNSSGCLSTSQCAPYSPRCSSSATNANTRSRRGPRPSSAQRRSTVRIVAAKSFMSTAPRPHT